MNNCFKSLLIILISFFYMVPIHAAKIDKIILFGDSLSDNGNLYYLLSSIHYVAPFVPAIPKTPPYFEGRFSNGPVWVEKVASYLNVPLINYAYGGSWAEPVQNSWRVFPFDIGTQVSFYSMKAVMDFNKKDHLYVIWAGSNDYLYNETPNDVLTTSVVASIKRQIDWLSYLGAKQFLVLGVPDFSHVPAIVRKGEKQAALLKERTMMHNKKLAAMIDEEKASHPDSLFINIDVDHYFNDVIEHPDRFGLKNTTDVCYEGNYLRHRQHLVNMSEVKAVEQQLHIPVLNNPSLKEAYLTAKMAEQGVLPCEYPEDYLFWDQLHPTTAMHQVIADLLMKEFDKNGIVTS